MTTTRLAKPPRATGPNYRSYAELIDRHHVWPHDKLTTDEVLTLVAAHHTWPSDRKANSRRRGILAVLTWLNRQDGPGWHQRWLNAHADRNLDWIDELVGDGTHGTVRSRNSVSSGLRSLLACRVLLPGYGFLDRFKNRALFDDIASIYGADVFDRMEKASKQMGLSDSQYSFARVAVVKTVLHTGRDADQLTVEDLLEHRAAVVAERQYSPNGIHTAWDLLIAVGVLPKVGTLREQLRIGQKSPEELVDRYPIQCRPIRDLLVRYMKERSPGLDYNSVRQLAASLANLFWSDIERHNPGIDSLHLPREVAEAWKRRLRYIDTDTGRRERDQYFSILVHVRGFYLDLQEWALEDPSWAPWIAPSPVRRGDTDGMSKVQRRASAVMHQRVRERLPMLPELMTAIETHHAAAGALLTASSSVELDAVFDYDGHRYRRVRTAPGIAGAHDAVLIVDVQSGQPTNVSRVEDEAFWVWAAVETLRHTGVRIEEMLELTQFALVSYTLPATGEVVPLLQIVPSKTNEERLLLVSPELASVLATIITRLRRDNGGTVPLVARYDNYEATTGPPLPHLFQRRHGARRVVIDSGRVRHLLNETLARTDLSDQAGRPLRFTPHDFRRMFTTEAVSNGLPVHIASRILGHRNINTTQAYLAIFQEDLISTYRHFLDQRRACRPSAEYRDPTDEEWMQFQQHFEERKVSLGTCGRPYGSPCRHEHACVRCPVLRVDPRQRQRLVEITRNLSDRISEAEHNGWRGEIQGLRISMKAAQDKLAALDRTTRRGVDAANLGMPAPRRRT